MCLLFILAVEPPINVSVDIQKKAGKMPAEEGRSINTSIYQSGIIELEKSY